MAALGCGVRVRTGTSEWLLHEGIALSEGTVADGPFEEGYCDADSRDGHFFILPERCWEVDIDFDPDEDNWLIEERLLFPIDGDDLVERDETLSETA